MVTEIALLTIHPDRAADLERAVAAAAPLFQAAPGCLSFKLEREIENPSRYRLIIGWESIEHHTVGFRNSEAFQKWRELAGPCFAAPSEVVHVALVAKHF